jgi:hypothetical protein
MKKFILFVALIVSVLFSAQPIGAQVRVHVNIGLQPLWGPTGYDYVDYYYIPDIDAYYDVPHASYVYFDDGRWITARELPPRYRDFDLYRAHKVVINEPSPWLRHEHYRDMYSGYRGRHDQEFIRDSHEEKYWENPGHPQHANWHGEGHGHDEGHGHGEGHDHGEGHGHDEGHDHGR